MSEDEITLKEAAEPLMEWLAANQHPHCTVIVTSDHAELVEGIEVVHLKKTMGIGGRP